MLAYVGAEGLAEVIWAVAKQRAIEDHGDNIAPDVQPGLQAHVADFGGTGVSP